MDLIELGEWEIDKAVEVFRKALEASDPWTLESLNP